MRYSLIHHDVREQFSLTIGDYLVCDSIHQLSHAAPTDRPNTQIAEFLGVDEGTVRNGKKKLLQKGLIEQHQKGFRTTKKWADTVTFARNNSEGVRSNSESGSEKSRHSITNINKQDRFSQNENPSEPSPSEGERFGEDGELLNSPHKRSSAVPKKRNMPAHRLNLRFAQLAVKFTGKPVRVAGYTFLSELLKTYTEQQLSEVMDWWFNEFVPNDDIAANIYKCFSPKNINAYLA